MRESFRTGIDLLLKLQRELKRPPARHKIKHYVEHIIKEADLRSDPRREYFTLLATCALLGKESMYNNFRSRRKHEIKTPH